MWLFDKVVAILAGKSTDPGEGTRLAQAGAPTVSQEFYDRPGQWVDAYGTNYQAADEHLYGEGGFSGKVNAMSAKIGEFLPGIPTGTISIVFVSVGLVAVYMLVRKVF